MIVRKRILLLVTLFISCVSSAQNILESHPRILLKSNEEPLILNMIEKHPRMKAIHQYIIDYSNATLKEEPLVRKTIGKRLLSVSRMAIQRIYLLSYSYRMTGDLKYAERAEKELLAVSSFSDWNPSHYLDVGEMTMAVAIGYDWLYSYLSESTREKLRKAIVEKGFDTAERGGFYDRVNNWNQVCNSGLVLGALAIYEDETEKSKKIIKKAIESVPLAMDSYLPDGAYPEGFSYWGYGTGFEVTMLAAMETALNTDFGLSEHSGFMRSSYFMLYMTTPLGLCYNYCDSGERIELNQAMYWFASKTNDPSLLWYEYSYLNDLKKYAGNDMSRLLPNILIFSKNIDLDKIGKPKGNFWFSKGIKPLFIYRSGWTNKNDTYLGIVGGSASISHGHMDAGSFIYEKNGIRWAIDLGLQSYYTLEKEGVDLWNGSQDGQRWDVFRLGNKAHSTLTVNGERHLVTGNPPIIETYQKPNCKGAKIDLTSLYGNSINKAVRTVTLDEKDNLNIDDHIEVGKDTAQITWVMVTAADAKIINKKEIELSKNGKMMRLKVISPANIEMKIWKNDPVHSYDMNNPGTLRVGFITKLNANTQTNFKLKLEN